MGSELVDSAYTLIRGARMLEGRLVELSLPQLRVLRLISKAPDRASRIAEKVAVSRPSLTGLLDGLEGHGWIRRTEVDGDRRGVALEITPAGRAALAKEEQALNTRMRAVFADLSPGEYDRVVDGLHLLSRAIEHWHTETTTGAGAGAR